MSIACASGFPRTPSSTPATMTRRWRSTPRPRSSSRARLPARSCRQRNGCGGSTVPAAGVGGMLFPEMVGSPVVLTNSRGMSAGTIAEHVLAVTLALFRRLPHAFRSQAAREWSQDAIGAEGNRLIAGARVLVVGLGAIGGAVAHRMTLLGARVTGLRRRAGRRDARRMDGRAGRAPARSAAGGRRGDRRCAAHARDARPHRPPRARADGARRHPRQRQPRPAHRRAGPHRSAQHSHDRRRRPRRLRATSRCRRTARSGPCRTCSSRPTHPASVPITGTPPPRSSPTISNASTPASRSSTSWTRGGVLAGVRRSALRQLGRASL